MFDGTRPSSLYFRFIVGRFFFWTTYDMDHLCLEENSEEKSAGDKQTNILAPFLEDVDAQV